MTKPFFHGDLFIKPGAIPEGAKPVARDSQKGAVLAYGEATGHAHAIADGAFLFEHDGTLYVRVEEGAAPLDHEEHGVKVLDPGEYEVLRQREYDYGQEMERQVID